MASLVARAIESALARDPRGLAAMEKILLMIEESGPRSRLHLAAASARHGSTDAIIDRMLALGLLAPIGKTRALVYGTPLQARTARKRKAA